MINTLQTTDFACVGLLTASCDNSKLCIAIGEAQIFDMEAVLCYDFFNKILDVWESLPDDLETPLTPEQTLYSNLIFGGTFAEGKKRHLGIKRLWVYYAYAKYILINQHSDTPNGLVSKQNEWSNPVTLKELNTIAAKYNNMAQEALKGIKEYLCANSSSFDLFDDCGCAMSCGCSGSCSCGQSKRVTGFKYKSVSK